MQRAKDLCTEACLKLKTKYGSVSPIKFGLVCIFGMGSWVAINGVWAELPILLITQPECYRLAAILSVVVQVANIGPLIYSIAKLICSVCHVPLVYLEVISVYTLLTIGVIASILLSFFWSTTGHIGGQSHSIVLIILTFFLALVDCTSSVVFVPFMKHFPAIYLSALYIGEGLSGVIPSILALIQGSVNNTLHCIDGGSEGYHGIETLGIRYSPSIFYILLSILLIVCGLAFTGLLILPVIIKLLKRQSINIVSTTEDQPVINCVKEYKPLVKEEEKEEEEVDNSEVVDESDHTMEEKEIEQFELELPCKKSHSILSQILSIIWCQRTPLVCVLLIGFITNGSLSSIAPYAFGHYGNTIIHLAINLGILANPIGAIIYAIVSFKSKLLVAVLTSVIALLSLYIMVHSMLSSDYIVPGITGGVIIVSEYTQEVNTC